VDTPVLALLRATQSWLAVLRSSGAGRATAAAAAGHAATEAAAQLVLAVRTMASAPGVPDTTAIAWATLAGELEALSLAPTLASDDDDPAPAVDHAARLVQLAQRITDLVG
jgi:hypothetical protein